MIGPQTILALSALTDAQAQILAVIVGKARLAFLGSQIANGSIAPKFAGGLINRALTFV